MIQGFGRKIRGTALGLGVLCAAALAGSAALAQGAATSLRAQIAGEVAGDEVLRSFYAARDYAPLWMGGSSAERRRISAFLEALKDAGDHALPVSTYRSQELAQAVAAADGVAERARTEAALSRSFAAYARDVQSGILDPARVSREIDRAAPRRGQAATLAAFAKSSPTAFLRSLPPQGAQYAGLLAEKTRLEKLVGAGGWGARVQGPTLRIGMSSAQVPVLRARLAALEYGASGGSSVFDEALQQQVARFQRDHGLDADGVVGPGTMGELNRSALERLSQVVVSMERERWMNFPRGHRYVEVNIPDFHARLIENGRVTFETRAVVGQNRRTHRTPEFSDVMDFMVINPTWHVPRSIATREYLPMLQQNANAVPQLDLVDANGQRVSRSAVNFANYTAGNFPYRLKEPPSDSNALGLVKFMFPNSHNIYLHDTPHKALFQRGQRAFSHGCIRLSDPFGFAYALLRGQEANPEAVFRARLATGRENVLRLQDPPRVHLIYRTAIAQPRGPAQYRPDIYGRDAAIFEALTKAGVSLRAAGG